MTSKTFDDSISHVQEEYTTKNNSEKLPQKTIKKNKNIDSVDNSSSNNFDSVEQKSDEKTNKSRRLLNNGDSHNLSEQSNVTNSQDNRDRGRRNYKRYKNKSNEEEVSNFVEHNVEISEDQQIVSLIELKSKSFEDLQSRGEELGIQNVATLSKQDLVINILKKLVDNGYIIKAQGVLEILPDGFGFLRSANTNYLAGPDDIYVSPNQIKKLGLKKCDTIEGQVRAPKASEKYFALLKIHNINHQPYTKNRVNFDNLVPLYPEEKLNLECEDNKKAFSTRIIDIVAPLGKGQRALIVAPPKTGKTMLLQDIAHAITKNNPEVYLMVILIDERPEEVTDMQRSINGEVISSTFDEPASRHVQLAEIAIEKAKRLVENKKDVVIILDSLTRLARAYNTIAPSSGKVLTGGVDANALQRPKRILGAARNIENGGSLTIIASALVETGSKMDEVIFEEFKGTGNAEIVLDRKLADKRVYPAIDIMKSGTRKDELLINEKLLTKTWMLRRIVSTMNTVDAMEFLLEKLKNTKNNGDFFQLMNN